MPPYDPDLDDSILKVFWEFEKDLKDDLKKMAFEDDMVVEVDKALKDNLKKFGLDVHLRDVSGMRDKIDFKK